eukprot:2204044-Alexandrium_andersonii.AAC.1
MARFRLVDKARDALATSPQPDGRLKTTRNTSRGARCVADTAALSGRQWVAQSTTFRLNWR